MIYILLVWSALIFFLWIGTQMHLKTISFNLVNFNYKLQLLTSTSRSNEPNNKKNEKNKIKNYSFFI